MGPFHDSTQAAIWFMLLTAKLEFKFGRLAIAVSATDGRFLGEQETVCHFLKLRLWRHDCHWAR
jgi:hypothetical protein